MKSKTRIAFYALLILLAVGIMSLGRFGEKEHSLSFFTFDTICDIKAYSISDKPLNYAKKQLEDYNRMWSASLEDSEISKINRGEEVTLSAETAELIDFANSLGREEYFSIYLNSLINAWDIKNNTGNIPDVSEGLLDAQNKNGINLGGIAKGFAADKVAAQLKEDGVESALISLGGNVYALGKKPTGEEWRVGIADPENPEEIIGSIRAENLAVVTSGDYQRYFEIDGIKYHHILNPKTGYPADSGLRSVTVIGENSALCDALSTMIFVSGVEKGAELLKEYNVGGILVTDDTVYFSKSIENIFKQDNFKYKYEFLF